MRLRQWGFHLLYHEMAWLYDGVAWLISLGRWQEWVDTVLPFVAGPRILEIGYGTGHLMASLSTAQGIQVIGVDESLQMARRAKRRASISGRLVRGVVQRLPLSSARFDTVVSTFPSEYISDPEALAEVLRVLAPGGRMVVLPLAWIGSKTRVGRAADWHRAFRLQLPAGVRERAVTALLSALSESAFQVSTHRLELPTSVVLVVVATR